LTRISRLKTKKEDLNKRDTLTWLKEGKIGLERFLTTVRKSQKTSGREKKN